MKLGEISEDIYDHSFLVQDGYRTPGYPYEETVIDLEAIDGTIFDSINMGARQVRPCAFNLAYMGPAQYDALQAYLEANAGQKVRVELEHAGERVFGELLTGPVIYAYLKKAEPLGETRFTQGHQDFGFALEMEYAGTTSNAVPNPADTSQYDFLVKIDCVQATVGCIQTNKAALDALTGVIGGSIGLTTSDRKVYIYNPTKAGGAGWDYRYTLPANTPSMGLKNGVIRLSSFADISGGSPGMDGEDWKSGWVPERGIKFPKYSVDARQGPAVEHLESFSFAIDNSTEVWKYPVENNISFYGARCELYVYDRQAGRLVHLRSGYNNQNAFETAVLHFKVEPGLLFNGKSFPAEVIGPDNFPDASKKVRGKTLQATFGRFDKGQLQAVAFESASIQFPSGRRYLNFVSWDGSNNRLVLDLPSSQLQTVLGYPLANYPQGVGRLLYVTIYSMAGNSEQKSLKRVTALADSSGQVRFTLEKPFEVIPDGTAIFLVYLANNQLVVDSEPVVGMRAAGYLVKGSRDAATAPLELFGEQEGELSNPIPDSVFKVIEDGKENKLVVDARFLAAEENNTIVIKDRVPLTQVDPSAIHGIVDQVGVEGPGGPSDHIDVFNFGFTPEGVESNEVKVKPFSIVSHWGDQETWKGKIIPGGGRVRAAFGSASTVLAWTPLQTATGYRVARYIVTPGNNVREESIAYRPDVYTLDPSFGTGGYHTVSGEQNNLYVDASVSTTLKLPYEYSVEPLISGAYVTPARSNRGFNRPKSSGGTSIFALGKDSGVTIIWPVPDAQAGFTVKRNGTQIDTVVSTTQGYYQATGLTNNTEYTFQITVQTILVGTNGDRWIQPSGTAGQQPLWWLLPADFTYGPSAVQNATFDKNQSDTTFEGWRYSWASKITRRNADGADLAAAGVVFSWLWKLDHKLLPDMSGAKDVRLLANFVVRSYYGNNTQVPIIIQCRLIKRDRTTAGGTIQHEGLQCKAPTEPGSYGAYAIFANLPSEKAGSSSDSQYDTEQHATNADATYTGKDMWKLDDLLFEDGAFEWKQVEYVMFSVTNAVPVPWSHVKPNGLGYRIGLGGPWGKNWTMVTPHKPHLFLEFTREFEGGLEQPPFGRIDGGRVDDAAGTATGTAGKIIEKARHVVDHVVHKTLGYKPTYIGTEMASRDPWLWRWQPKESKPLLENLEMFARNLDALITFTPDDKICIRNYGIDEPGVQPAYTFTEQNILADSFGDPEYRRRNEIYQKILAKYSIEPSLEDQAVEEMLIGWDMVQGKPIFGGYQRVEEDADGVLQFKDSHDGMEVLCQLSTYLYAAGGKVNEYGIGPGNEKVFEMFYRPTRPGSATGLTVERDLPNLATLWPGAMQPKAAMQARFCRLVKSLCFESWYFPIGCSMRNLIYNPEVAGILNEGGTAEHRLKIGDLIGVRGKKTSGQTLKGQILGMDLQGFYDGRAVLDVFCPRPPGQFSTFVDPNWDAGAPGARNQADYVFQGNLYGLLGEAGTFADAGAPGGRNETQYRFPDGSTADAQGSGSGKA